MNNSPSSLFAGTAIGRQIELESRSVQEGVARYRRLVADATKRGKAASLKPIERFVVAWMPALTESISKARSSYMRGENSTGSIYWGPILAAIKPEKAAYIAIDRILSILVAAEEPVSYTTVCSNVGAAIMAEINLQHTLHAMKQAAKELSKREARRERALLDNLLDRTDAIAQINRTSRKKHPLNFDTPINRCSVGDRIANMLFYGAGILPHEEGEDDPENVLAFKVQKVFEKNRHQRVVSLRKRAHELIEQGHKYRQGLRPQYLPMLVPPYRREKGKPGGYITIRTPFVTKSTKEQQEAYAKANLAYEYDALYEIGDVPVRIMTPIMDVIRILEDQGGDVASIPPFNDPPKPERPPEADTSPEIERKWKREAAQWYDDRIELRSARKNHSLIMEVASTFRDEPEFYYPHQNDYRGRVYPIPQHLSRSGPDICKGLLTFAHPVEPDKFWIAVHAANCAGFDKETFENRARWAMEWYLDHSVSRWIGNAGSIADHADEWASDEIDSPWQFLASLIAMSNDEWAARLPVQFDGSCNGLQHFAAMTLDENLAELVNLTPRDKPTSIYNVVAERTVALLKEIDDPLARMAIPLIDKNVVKQPTMTKCYGVTFAGVRDQIRWQLEDKGVIGEPLFPMAQLLAKVVQKAVGQLCGRAEDAMAWITDTAKRLADHNIAYGLVAPTGFPMVQPYRQWHTKRLRCMDGSMAVVLENKECPVAKGKHVSGAVANTIHMMDMSHMKACARESHKLGIPTFFTHDGFSCASGNVTRYKLPIVHRKFVDLYNRNWMIEFYNQIREKHPNVKIDHPPERGSFDINSVMDATFAFH